MTPAPASRETWADKQIGLLGGSFNPAHEGHVAISEAALQRLSLDAVWWLVSPQNPLKQAATLAPFDTRVKQAEGIVTNPRIKVMDFEGEENLRYTIETLEWLGQQFPTTNFVWLMGVDCLDDFAKWKSWEKIMNIVPFAIFARPGYSIDAFKGEAAVAWEKNRLPEGEANGLARKHPPAWVYLEGPLVDVSATQLRRPGGAN